MVEIKGGAVSSFVMIVKLNVNLYKPYLNVPFLISILEVFDVGLVVIFMSLIDSSVKESISCKVHVDIFLCGAVQL